MATVTASSARLRFLERRFRSEHLGKVEQYQKQYRTAPAIGISAIDKLINDNNDIWEKLLKNNFCYLGYIGEDPLFDKKWCWYAKQDYLYLLDSTHVTAYRRFQHMSTARDPNYIEGTLEKIKNDLDYAVQWKKTCIARMGITEQDFASTDRSPALIGYSSWEQLGGITQDFHATAVMMLPCLYGWGKIANHLLEAYGVPNNPNKLFYEFWYGSVQDSRDHVSSVILELESYLQGPHSTEEGDHWNVLFREACEMEIGLFNSALAPNLNSPPSPSQVRCD